MDLGLRGKRALITGASQGIGAAAATALAEEGCHLRLAARDDPRLQALARHLRKAHDVEISVHVTDLRQADSLQHLAQGASDVDILINNAGDAPSGPLHTIDDRTWRHAWELKVFGYINLTRLVYGQMKERGHGVIINDIGISGDRVDADYIVGTTGNAALMAFTRALGGRSLQDNIRVVAVSPGPVGTDRVVALMKQHAHNQFGNANLYPDLMAQFPKGRAATPREVADVMAFLASDRAGYISGAVVPIDGGMSVRGT